MTLFSEHDRFAYMSAIKSNDINRILSASVAGCGVDEFEQAYRILTECNPGWSSLSEGDVLKAYIKTLETRIYPPSTGVAVSP